VPTYQYRCEECGKSFELIETISEHGPSRKAALKAAGIELSNVLPLEYALAVLRHPESTPEERRWACEKAMPFCHARPGEASTQPTVAINGPSKVELVVIGSNEYNARYPDPARLLTVRAARHS